MTQEEIIRMAREAGIIFEPMTIDGIEYGYRYVRCSDSIGKDEADCIERFAAIVFEAGCTYEREKLTAELINEAQREVQRAVLATIRAARTQEFTAEQQDRFATAFDEAFAKAGLPQKQAEQEPVAQQDSDDKRLLREIFMLCEATEELEPTNDFMRGRIFEAKGIRRGIGNWYQDTFCGRSYMGEPVLNAAPVQQAEQEPVARVSGYYGGRCVVEPLNRATVLPTDMALYAAPVQQVTRADLKAAFKEGFERAADLYAPNDGQEPYAYEVWDVQDQSFTMIYATQLKEFHWIEPENIARVLYAAPVRTKDLTDEELWEAAKTAKSNDLTDAFRAVIAADRRKNK